MKKVVLKLYLSESRTKDKAMKKVSGFSGVESISFDMEDNKLTVIGNVDTAKLVNKLKKICSADILSIGPAKEPEKKKEQPKMGDEKKKDPQEELAELARAHQAYPCPYHPPCPYHHYYYP